jgi:murein DD-endopeptidase MepM/ murein hydrolase activator NlpD
MRIQGLLEQQRGRPRASSRSADSADDMTEYFRQELENQRQSRIGQKVQKATMFPGMALGTLARYSKEIDLEKKIKSLASVMSKTGKAAGKGADTEALVDAITKAGGLGYMASVGPLNVMRQKRLAYERGLKPQLGGVGTASSALDTLSMANRSLITPRILSMIMGGGMPSSLQSSMGLYGAGLPMAKGLAKMAGTQLPGAMTSGIGGAMTGMAPFMAAQMGLSMMKQRKIARITAQRKAGSEVENKVSLSRQLDSQINQLAQKGMIQPGEQIRIQLLKWIESHTAVLPEIWAEQQYIREEKEKGGVGAGKAYSKGLGSLEDRGFVASLVDKAEGFTSKALSKYDIFGQIFNFLSTGKLPKQFQEELEMAYQDLTGEDRRQAKSVARQRGISLDQSRLLEMPSKRIIDMGTSHDVKMLSILGASFDVQRLMGSELLTIRRSGFGVQDNLIKSDSFEKSTMGKLGDFLSAPFRAVANIPGVNALMNMAKFPFKVTGMARSAIRGAWGGAKRFLVGGEDTQRLLQSETELRKEAGIYKSPQEMSYEFVGRGLPDIMEEMRTVGWRQVQELANIYTVVAMQLQATTGVQHQRDDRTYGPSIKKGAWSYTAGKYLDEKGLQDQQKQDRERMEVALERAFKGSGMDRLGWLVDKMVGRKRGEAPVLERLMESTKLSAKVEEMPFEMLRKAEGKGALTQLMATLAASPLTEIGQQYTFTPEEVMQAAMFRQREVKGRGRGRVVEGWLGAKQARAEMSMESDIGPKIVRGLGLGAGGLTSAAGMASMGLVASLASGGSLIPILLAASAGGSLGSIPQTFIEFAQAQKMFPDISFAKMKEAALGYTKDIPAFMADGTNKTKVRTYLKEAYGEKFVKEIGADKDSFFENINNMPYVVMGLQGSTGVAFTEEMKMGGLGGLEAAYKFKDQTRTPGSAFSRASGFKNVDDLYNLFRRDSGSVDKAYARVVIAGIEPKLDPMGPLPVSAGPMPSSGIADDYSGKLLSMVGRKSKKMTEREREIKHRQFADVLQAEGFAKGGPVRRTGLAYLHKGEEVIPPGGPRNLKQELSEVAAEKEKKEARKWEDTLLDKFDSMLDYLENIGENTEGISEKKTKKDGGMFGSLFSSLFGGLKSMLGGVFSLLTGGIGLRALMGKGASAVGRGIWGATKGLGKGLGKVAGKFGSGFMESGLGQSISNKLFDAKFAARGLAKRFAPSRLLGKGVAGAKDLLGKIPGMSRAGEIAGKFAKRLPGQLGRVPGALGKGAGNLLGKLGGVGMAGIMGAGGTIWGAMNAQKEYGDLIGEDLSLGQKIGLGANTGLKAMTFGLLDIEKMTGAKKAKEELIKSKEQQKKIAESTKNKIQKYCSPNALEAVRAHLVGDDWASALSAARKTGGIIRSPNKSMWITDADLVEIDTPKGTMKINKSGMKWSSLLKKDVLQYRFYRDKGDQHGAGIAVQSLKVLAPDYTPDELVKLYEATFEKKAPEKEVKEDPKRGTKMGSAAALARAEQLQKINSPGAALAMAESNMASLQTEAGFSEAGLGDRASREGGIFGAIKSMVGNAGMNKSTLDTMAQRVGMSMDQSGFIWPGSMFITSPFGPRNTGLPGASKMHRGVDMRATDVVASAAGTVSNINSKWGSVTIDHGQGIRTKYTHMGPILVKKGDVVQAGQKIGTASNVGPIPGMKSHLHYEIKAGNTNLDPEMVFSNTQKFKPSYNSDISEERRIQAKLANKPLDVSKLKTEGAEAAGPFNYDRYDPVDLRGSLSAKINQVQQDNKRKQDVQEYQKTSSSQPQIIPIPISASGGDTTRVGKNKSNVLIDPDLDQFINTLFRDCAHAFSDRYKSYVYHSNVAHSFI